MLGLSEPSVVSVPLVMTAHVSSIRRDIARQEGISKQEDGGGLKRSLCTFPMFPGKECAWQNFSAC